MLLSLAWKNIWRNKKRSLIVLVAIALGLWGALLSGAVMTGWGESLVETAVDRNLGHIQLHQPGFIENREVARFIPHGIEILDRIRSMPGVKAVSGRTLVDGMAASAASTFGVSIEGIDPAQAARVTTISRMIVAGSYFGGTGKNPIVVGSKLAERLHLRLRSKVVLSFQAMNGNLVYAAFRVRGIFKSDSAQFDKTHVFLRRPDLLRLLGCPPVVHEIVVRAISSKHLPQLAAALKAAYPGLSVKTWKELSPEVAVAAAAMEGWSYIFVGVILAALIFGITNTMLMAVMERVQELGILLAVGMKKSFVFTMILLETVMLSLTGGVCGMLLGKATVMMLAHTGIDLSAFASSLERFGTGTRLYPYLPAGIYFALLGMIIVAACLASTIPAIKAVRLQPSEAIRTG